MGNTNVQAKPKAAVKRKETLTDATILAMQLQMRIEEALNLNPINHIIATKYAKGKAYVYALYTAKKVGFNWDSKLEYVGITWNPSERIETHSKVKKGLFTHVSIIYCTAKNNRNLVAHAEAILISKLKPPLNTKFNPQKDETYKDPRKIKCFVEK